MIYLAIKSVHLIAVLVFAGGLMALALVISGWIKVRGVVLPHEKSIGRAVLRWDNYVTVPAMLGSWAFGLSLAVTGGWMGQGWLVGKIALVIVLSGLHGALKAAIKKRIDGGHVACSQWQNVSPILVASGMAVIALLVTIKPSNL